MQTKYIKTSTFGFGYKNLKNSWAVGVHVFILSTWEAEAEEDL